MSVVVLSTAGEARDAVVIKKLSVTSVWQAHTAGTDPSNLAPLTVSDRV
jgi:hypothetical protein